MACCCSGRLSFADGGSVEKYRMHANALLYYPCARKAQTLQEVADGVGADHPGYNLLQVDEQQHVSYPSTVPGRHAVRLLVPASSRQQADGAPAISIHTRAHRCIYGVSVNVALASVLRSACQHHRLVWFAIMPTIQHSAMMQNYTQQRRAQIQYTNTAVTK